MGANWIWCEIYAILDIVSTQNWEVICSTMRNELLKLISICICKTHYRKLYQDNNITLMIIVYGIWSNGTLGKLYQDDED